MHDAGDIGVGEFHAATVEESMIHSIAVTLHHGGTIAK
jgi:hypothetical protein